MDLNVCFISTEFFDWGKYGGIGKATRLICTELVKRGIKVSVVVPRGKNQKPVEYVNNVFVYSHKINEYPFTSNIFKKISADIYHSEEPSWGTLIAQKNLPKSIHIATSQNPKDVFDWKMTIKYYKFRRRLFNLFIEKWINQNIFKLDKIFCQAKYIIPKTRELYKLNYDPSFLPNPIKVPLQTPKKAEKPIVCFLGRFDREKNPERFFELSKEFPEIEFIGMGQAHNIKLDKYYRDKYSNYQNLLLPGLVVGKNKTDILDKSWILVNTSEFECLPISFLEAAAHR
ncbi:glycosyltransferase family 4 protein, partial [Candidatus Bathyarchaeota archaeon]|nr:glycosyltransferase family 4 protein [Candidatus Bathyarchaeota archaeon]